MVPSRKKVLKYGSPKPRLGLGPGGLGSFRLVCCGFWGVFRLRVLVFRGLSGLCSSKTLNPKPCVLVFRGLYLGIV